MPEPNSNEPERQSPQGRPQPPKSAKPAGRGLMSWVFIIGLMIVLFAIMQQSTGGREISSWQDFRKIIDPASKELYASTAGSPDPVLVKSDRIVATVKPEIEGLNATQEPALVYHRIDGDSREFYLKQLEALKVDFATDTSQSVWGQLLITIIPILIGQIGWGN